MSNDAQREFNAIVTQRMEVAPGLIVMDVAPDGWELPGFEPGQYAVIGLPGSAPRCRDAEPEDHPADPDKLIKRAYSIASSSQAKQYLEFYIALVRSGTLTPRLMVLNPGDRLWLGHKITGMFTLDSVPPECHIIMFATGTGLAPYVSMMRTVLAAHPARRFAVVHGARHSWELGYRDEMMAFHRFCPEFEYVPIVSRPREEPIPWGGLVGHSQDVWTRRVIDQLWGFSPSPENTHIFLCGNPAMIQDMIQLLAAEGFHEHSRRSPGQVHTEKYW
jgi:ferredoxin--NADP+ reductase